MFKRVTFEGHESINGLAHGEEGIESCEERLHHNSILRGQVTVATTRYDTEWRASGLRSVLMSAIPVN